MKNVVESESSIPVSAVEFALTKLMNTIYNSLEITLENAGFKSIQDFNYTWDRIQSAFELSKSKLIEVKLVTKSNC